MVKTSILTYSLAIMVKKSCFWSKAGCMIGDSGRNRNKSRRKWKWNRRLCWECQRGVRKSCRISRSGKGSWREREKVYIILSTAAAISCKGVEGTDAVTMPCTEGGSSLIKRVLNVPSSVSVGGVPRGPIMWESNWRGIRFPWISPYKRRVNISSDVLATGCKITALRSE